MTNQLLIILVSSAVALINAILLAKFNRSAKIADSRQEQMTQIQKDVDLLKAGYITADRLRLLIKEELHDAFTSFELRLVNDGRINPKRSKQ